MDDLTVTLPITNDEYTEGPESFSLTLNNPTTSTDANVGLGEDTTVTTTIDDVEVVGTEDLDGPAEWAISGPDSSDEGEDAIFTISLSETFGENENASIDITFDELNTNANDYDNVVEALRAAAEANDDVIFTANAAGDGGTFTYTSPADGASMTDLTVTLPITNDQYTEGAEEFNFSLSNPLSNTGAFVDVSEDNSVTTEIDDVEVAGGTDLDGPAEWTITGDTTIDEEQLSLIHI